VHGQEFSWSPLPLVTLEEGEFANEQYYDQESEDVQSERVLTFRESIIGMADQYDMMADSI
jgi:hypothetical protein